MTQTTNQSEPMEYQTDYQKDGIEVIDILRVIWKWKYLIIGGTIICAAAVLVINLMLPKIYRVETLIRPGVLSFNDDGERIYIDTPNNIKAQIEYGTFDFNILSNLSHSNGADVPKALKFKVTLANSSNALKINYETSRIELGLEILDLLNKLLIKEYSNFIEYFQSKIDGELNIAKAEIQKVNSIKDSGKMNINIIEKRIQELEAGIILVEENTDYLDKERNKLLMKEKNDSNILSSILYSNTIQQNLQLANHYKSQIQELRHQKETELQNISEQENILQRQLAEIKDLEIRKRNISNIEVIRQPYSFPAPIKPQKSLNVILAVFVGIFMMIFLSFLLEYISKNFVQRPAANK